MAIRTNLKDLSPAAGRFKREIILPSGGYSNPQAFPEGKITVYPWDISTSEWMTTANKANETAFTTGLVARITHLSLDTVKTLVSSEMPLIMMVSRALTFADNSVPYTATCPFCGTVQARTVLKVPDDLEKVGEKAPGYTMDKVTLPVSQDVLGVRPITVQEEQNARGREKKVPESDLDAVNMAAIRTVNDTEPDNIAELARYYLALHPADIEHLIVEMANLSPGLSTRMKHKCDKPTCQKVFGYELSLMTDFFRQ